MSTTKEIGSLDASGVRSFIDSFDTLICDCDGVLWRGHTPMPGSAATVSKLHTKYGKRIMYITNNSVKTRAQNVKKLIDFGYPATKVCVPELQHLVKVEKSNHLIWGR